MSVIRYSIWNPTGNVTALVESGVPIERQPKVAELVMSRHSCVEQVGFVRFEPSVSLRMAGGEFCGNASICAAALAAQKDLRRDSGMDERSMTLAVSGARDLVRVMLSRKNDAYRAKIQMPWMQAVLERRLSHQGIADVVPVVMMEGISHAVITPGSALFALRADDACTRTAVRVWCKELGVDGLGLMFYEPDVKGGARLTPLVYVPGSDTVYWEHSCASGSAAVGMWQSYMDQSPVDLMLREPGGTLRVRSDAGERTCWLYGFARKVGEYELS